MKFPIQFGRKFAIVTIFVCRSVVYEYHIAGKFGGELKKKDGLVVCLSNHQIKIRQDFLLAYNICMAIPYWTAKFKSTNTFAIAIWDPTTKFNSCKYFWLHSIRFPSFITQLGCLVCLLTGSHPPHCQRYNVCSSERWVRIWDSVRWVIAESNWMMYL